MFREKEFDQLISYAITAHRELSRTHLKRVRKWDESTPYSIHPIWCATTLLHETSLPESIRIVGAQALLLHDILEDTTAELPPNINPEVRKLVEEVTFESSQEAMQKIWERSDEAKLITLYDMVSNMLDGVWMSDEQKELYSSYTRRLTDFVEKRVGNLNIVKIARSLV